MRYVEIWMLCGVCYWAVVLTKLIMSPIGDRVVQKLKEHWEKCSLYWWSPPILAAVALLYVAAWPVVVAIAALSSTRDRAADNFRRTFLDREDLFKPQMPARRCPLHDVALDMKLENCAKCKLEYENGYCEVCMARGLCPHCGLERKNGRCDACGRSDDLAFVCFACDPPTPVCMLHNAKTVERPTDCRTCGKSMNYWACDKCAADRPTKMGDIRCVDCFIRTMKLPIGSEQADPRTEDT